MQENNLSPYENSFSVLCFFTHWIGHNFRLYFIPPGRFAITGISFKYNNNTSDFNNTGINSHNTNPVPGTNIR